MSTWVPMVHVAHVVWVVATLVVGAGGAVSMASSWGSLRLGFVGWGRLLQKRDLRQWPSSLHRSQWYVGGMPSTRFSMHTMLLCDPLHCAHTGVRLQPRVGWPKPWQVWHCVVDDDEVGGTALGRLPGLVAGLESGDRRCLVLLGVFQSPASSGEEAAGAGTWSSRAGAAGAEVLSSSRGALSSSREVFFCALVLVLVLVLGVPRRGGVCVLAGTALPTRGS